VHELVRVELELLDRPRHERLQELGAWHVLVLLQPGFEATRDSGCLRHPADAGRQVEHALALRDRELTEQEEGFARLGGDPVRIAPPRIQIGDGSLLCRLRRDLGEEILDFEGSQLLVFRQVQIVHCSHRCLPKRPAAQRGRRDEFGRRKALEIPPTTSA
jgi:hypothetical protein